MCMSIFSHSLNLVSAVNISATAERKKMLSRLRITEDAISAEDNRRCYLGRG